MSWVWEHADAEGAEMLVLLALADHASDEGVCYPSMARIARYARITERGAQKAARSLEGKGLLVTERNAGPKGCNLYRVNMVHPRTEFTPNMDAGGGEHGCLKPPNVVHPNHKEPSKNRQAPFRGFQKRTKPKEPGIYDGPETITDEEAAATRARIFGGKR